MAPDPYDPVLLVSPLGSDGDPRLIDTIFNVSSLTSGIFNNSLFQYAGLVIVGIILLGILHFVIKRFFREIFRANVNILTFPCHHKTCLICLNNIYVTTVCFPTTVILLISEIALYALDVYYNQTYLNQSSKSR